MRFTIERTYRATLAEVWELWTTKAGLESWWGPEGFTTEVEAIDLRPGGELRYAMTATRDAEVQFMKQAGLPLTQHVRARWAEIAPKTRLSLVQTADFIPGVKPYDITNTVALTESGGSVRMVVTVDGMHDQVWTERARMGWESQIGRLGGKILAKAG